MIKLKKYFLKLILLSIFLFIYQEKFNVVGQIQTNLYENYYYDKLEIQNSRGDSLGPKLTILPFAIYSEMLGWGVGGFMGLEGLSAQNAAVYSGGLMSTNGTKYGFIQFRNFMLPFFPRLYIEPDILGGYFGTLRVYKNLPDKDSQFEVPAGRNDSHEDNYQSVNGYDQWYELNIRYLLPIGHAEDKARFVQTFENGILKKGTYGGTSLNPLESGRTFIDIMPFYRKRVNFATNGIEFALTHENVDFFNNPTKGTYEKIAYRKDWGLFDSFTEWDVVKGDLRAYLPIHEYLGSKNDLPKVLALNIWTVNTLSWDDYHIEGQLPSGQPRRVYHRPPPYSGAYLGGRYHMRAYYEGRFSDKAVLYYGAEYRQILDWNPFEYLGLAEQLNVHWLQWALFAELGRVAPEWHLPTFHKDMKWSTGSGIRIMLNTLVLRMDAAYSPEGLYIQMYVDHAF